LPSVVLVALLHATSEAARTVTMAMVRFMRGMVARQRWKCNWLAARARGLRHNENRAVGTRPDLRHRTGQRRFGTQAIA
jgi:hypothetical protein